MSFRKEKYRPKGGPDGGHGGNGGNIIFCCSTSVFSLYHLRNKRFEAERGSPGEGNRKKGKKGKDLVIFVPLGTELYVANSDVLLYKFNYLGERFIALRGGRGGAGNTAFTSSIHRAPRTVLPGEKGEGMSIDIEARLLSDVAIIGLPNAGKSTLVSFLTKSSTKVADYPFSTLYPAIASLYYRDEEYTLADIPGLVEGASSGKGLGERSLKQVEKSKCIVHLVSVDSNTLEKDLLVIEDEIKTYFARKKIEKKKHFIALSKVDKISLDELQKKKESIEKLIMRQVYVISKSDISSMQNLLLDAIRYVKDDKTTICNNK